MMKTYLVDREQQAYMDEKDLAIAKPQLAQTTTPPDDIPAPAFIVGVSKVRWKQMTSSDWGLVMGMRYGWAKHKREFEWQYYVVLDSDSPSHQWTSFDWGWQDDLEVLPPTDP